MISSKVHKRMKATVFKSNWSDQSEVEWFLNLKPEELF